MDLCSAVYSFLWIFSKNNCFLFFSYWLHLLLIVCGDIESYPGPDSDRRVLVLYSNIRGLHANMDELALAGSGYDVLVCTESKVSDRRHLLKLHISRFGCPQERLRNSTPGIQGMALYVRERFHSFRQIKLECSGALDMCLVCFVSPII